MLRRTWGVGIAACVVALWPAGSAFATTYTVTDPVDASDLDPTDATCESGGGDCSLRAAVQTANSPMSPGLDMIEIPAGTYAFGAPLDGDDDAAALGDLDITDSVEIRGLGSGATVDALLMDRVLHIPSGGPAVTLTNLTITRGTPPETPFAMQHGAGIKHESGSLTIANSTITDNNAPGSSPRGGGIYSAGGTSLTLTDVNVNGNQAPQDASVSPGAQGGGVYSLTPVTFTRVGIYGNNANFGCGGICGGNGGGLFVGSGTLTNVTISGNIAGGNAMTGAGAGGGLAAAGGTLTVVNSTIQRNYAMGPGGVGGGNIASGDGLFLRSTIVSDGETIDRAAGTENCGNDTGSPTAFNSLGNNLEARAGQGASQCGLSPGVNGDLTATSAGLDPVLAFSAGSPTPTHALLPGSPAIDAGALTGPATDQRGVSRPQGPRCDIGAFELEQAGTIPGSTCAGPPSGPGPSSTGPASTTPPSATPRKRCKKGRKLKKGKCVKKKKRR
jgi:hypothetical protein